MIIDPSLRDMILFIYHHFYNLSSGSGGGGNVTTSQLNTALADKVDKGGYTGTAQDLKNAIDTVDSKTIHWNDVQNKPELDFIPTSWNKKNGGTIIDTSGEDWLEINAEDFSNEGVSFGKSSLRTTAHYEAVDSDDNNKSTRVGPSFILFDRNAAIVKETGRTLAFEDFNLSGEYVYVKVAGVKIGDNIVGNRLLLDNGETKPLTDFATTTRLNEINDKISDLTVGGKNYVLDSKRKRTLNGYVSEYWTLTEPVIVGRKYILSCYATVETGRRLTFYFADKPGRARQYIIFDLVEGYNEAIVRPNFEWDKLCAFHEVSGISPAPIATVEKLKFEIGNHSTDWTPAPEEIEAAFLVDSFFDSVNNALLAEASGKNIVFSNSTDVIVSLNNIKGDTITKIIKKTPNKITFTGGIYLTSNEISGVGIFEVYLGNDGKVIIR